ncbi:hypothetical protein VNI00_011843 [Paramarasmius palmivorus]|uniref:Uncharacterized protein n=1 Tax=Paramarasmius palmivorus TaxID=297713 RepID=A0AAW0C844_9AGAR
MYVNEDFGSLDISVNVGDTDADGKEFLRQVLVDMRPFLCQSDLELEGQKSVLYFPMRGVPCIVNMDRCALYNNAFYPYLDASLQGNAGTRILRKTYMFTEPPENYVVVYFEQSEDNRFPSNEFATSVLQTLGNGLRRPWMGPMLVDYQDSKVLTEGDLHGEAMQVLGHIHAVYERLHCDKSIAFDPMPFDSSIKHISVNNFILSHDGTSPDGVTLDRCVV